MASGVTKGRFAHIVGTFDLGKSTGTIDYVTPVGTATEPAASGDEKIHLVGEGNRGQQIFDKAVNPQRNSCAPNSQRGTFAEFVPVSPELTKIRLTIAGTTVAEFFRGTKDAIRPLSLAVADRSAPHRLALDNSMNPTAGTTYIVQARADDDDAWQTLAVGLPTPSTYVDVNQFPGAKRVQIRILQSDGFSETEVFNDTQTF
jgi:hypothetical protein